MYSQLTVALVATLMSLPSLSFADVKVLKKGQPTVKEESMLTAMQPAPAPARKYEPMSIQMKSRLSGKAVNFKDTNVAEVEAEFKAANLALPNWMPDCKNPDRVNFTNVELELELGFLIESLQDDEQEQLTESQQDLLKRVPLCQNYLVKLKVIALLLQNYRLVKSGDAEILAGF